MSRCVKDCLGICTPAAKNRRHCIPTTIMLIDSTMPSLWSLDTNLQTVPSTIIYASSFFEERFASEVSKVHASRKTQAVRLLVTSCSVELLQRACVCNLRRALRAYVRIFGHAVLASARER
eukprot:IDg15253t1